jgi:phosphoribosylamine--glycine ligase
VNVLILGAGGREHAIAWKLKQDQPDIELIVAPGNPGIAELGRCVRINPADPAAVVALAETEGAKLVIVGPEAPLAAGVVDALRAHQIPAFGPTAGAAQIEASKRFSKELMLRVGIPTARATSHRDPASAKRSAAELGVPVVIKASGLAAGKGVVVAGSVEDAEHAIDDMMLRAVHGSAGSEVLVEEFMEGEELSLFVITDGTHFVLLPAAQDHKRLLEGDRGPNTGGMGAYTPVSVANRSTLQVACDRIIEPTLAALRKEGVPFTGLLYAGLMLTRDGPRVVEFNCRFGDPETQVVLPALDAPLLDLLDAASRPGGISSSVDRSRPKAAAVTTVIAAPGYPESPRIGDRMVLPEEEEGVIVFHAGTSRAPDGALVTSGGRVLAVTGIAPDFTEAARRSREHAAKVRLDGSQFRSDIGWRERARNAGAS